MANATDTPSTSSPACEIAPEHTIAAQARCPEHAGDGPTPLFGRGEIDHIIRRYHEDDADPLQCAWNLAEADCTSLDGIAAKLEWLAQRQFRDLDPRAPGHGWKLTETVAVMSSVLDLHRIIRRHEGEATIRGLCVAPAEERTR